MLRIRNRTNQDPDPGANRTCVTGSGRVRTRPLEWGRWCLVLCLGLCFVSGTAPAQDAPVRTKFRVKYVAPGTVYLEGGREAGLAEGQKLTIRREAPETDGNTSKGTAEIRIISVASTSAAAEVLSSDLDLRAGDVACLSAEDEEKLKLLSASTEAHKYPQVISFTEGDPMDEEARENIPRPPLPEVNRARGRFGVEYNSIHDTGSGTNSSQLGIVLRADMTRLGGSYWNLSGYYRGRLNSRTTTTDQQTLTDLINRTYHLSLTYNNPESHWVAGFGRLYLPWASSLDTIDGGYLGRHYGKTTFGLFGGSAPDPTSWRYDPNRQMGGVFVNYEGGSYDAFRYTNTFGFAITRVNWHPDRQFAFFENGFFYKQFLAIYHDLETDLLRANSLSTDSGPAVSRDYLTVRIQPTRVIGFDVSENYFRNVPTFDERLIGTGLLDKYLFQGLSGGVHLELPYHMGVYSSLGSSHRSGDEKQSWNQMYGIRCGDVWHTGIRADVRYTKFDSSFGSGTYRSVTLSRDLSETFRFDVEVGQQNFISQLSSGGRARWVTSYLDWLTGRHYFLGSGFTIYRGQAQNYNQWFLNLGYRF